MVRVEAPRWRTLQIHRRRRSLVANHRPRTAAGRLEAIRRRGRARNRRPARLRVNRFRCRHRTLSLRRFRPDLERTSRPTPASTAAPGISAASPWIRIIRISSIFRTPRIYRSDGRRQDLHGAQRRARRRRLPLPSGSIPTIPARMIQASDQGVTISVDGGKTWSILVQPAHRAVLPRRHRQSVSVSRLRIAAGQRNRRCCPAAPITARSPNTTGSPWATPRAATSRPIRRIPTFLRQQYLRNAEALRQAHLARPDHHAVAGAGFRLRISRSANTVFPGPRRWCFRRWITRSITARSMC